MIAAPEVESPVRIDRSVALNVRNLDRDTRNQFKAYCAQRSLNMQEAICILIQMAIRGEINLKEVRGDVTD